MIEAALQSGVSLCDAGEVRRYLKLGAQKGRKKMRQMRRIRLAHILRTFNLQ